MNDIPEFLIEEIDAKVFNFQSLIFIFDNERHSQFSGVWKGCDVKFSNPVKVFNEENQVLGCANLVMEGDKLIADFFLDYAIPERLDIETGAIKLYPFVQAQTTSVYEDHVNKYVKTDIECIRLIANQVIDDRVGPVGI